jgi:hypothetical protein
MRHRHVSGRYRHARARAFEHGPGRGVGWTGGAQLGEDDADVAQAGEYAVELRLVGDLDGDGFRVLGLQQGKRVDTSLGLAV